MSESEKRTTSVTPAPGQMETVARELLDLADSPEDVIYRSRGGYFEVPEELAVKYAAQQANDLAARIFDVPAEILAAGEPAKGRSRRRAKAGPADPAAPAAEKPARRQRASSAQKATDGEAKAKAPAKPRANRAKRTKGGEK